MSERRHESEFGPWTHRIPVPASTRSILVLGAWLALTILFLFGSVVLIGTVVTLVGESRRVLSSMIALIGVLAACGISPTLAQVVVVEAVERSSAVFDQEDDAEPGELEFSVYEKCDRERCGSPYICCR